MPEEGKTGGTKLTLHVGEDLAKEISPRLVEVLLKVVPELARRARYGEFLNDDQAQEATGLTKRQLRYLRETGRIPYRSIGQRSILYKTAELFAAIDEGTVTVRETFD